MREIYLTLYLKSKFLCKNVRIRIYECVRIITKIYNNKECDEIDRWMWAKEYNDEYEDKDQEFESEDVEKLQHNMLVVCCRSI